MNDPHKFSPGKPPYLLTWQKDLYQLAKEFDTMFEAANYLQALLQEHPRLASITLHRRVKHG